VVAEITRLYAAASRPIVLVDACCGRFGMANDVRKLVEGCDIRFFTTPMGKALLDEHHPLFGGCYAGANSLDAVRKEVEEADFALYVGALKSDFNSGSFSVKIDPKVVIELHSFTTVVGVSQNHANLPLTCSTPITLLPTCGTYCHDFSSRSRMSRQAPQALQRPS
jgi:pyruvate decarboxylase